MPPFDDIPVDNPASETEGRQGPNPATPRRSIGPESEARGGPEAPAETCGRRPSPAALTPAEATRRIRPSRPASRRPKCQIRVSSPD